MNTEQSSLLHSTATRRRNMYWTIGCVYGATAVCAGAFGAHGLKKRISDPGRIGNFATAAQYQVRRSTLRARDMLGTGGVRVSFASTAAS